MRGLRPSHTLTICGLIIMELHATVKHVKRSKGRSSVAAAAYRLALKLEDNRTGLIHDYTRKNGVELSQTFAPDHAPDWVHDPAKLWNAVEQRERHVKAETAHELELAFPHEFTATQRQEVGEKVSRELVSRYGCAVMIAYHEPSKNGDDRNYHAHLLFTTRGFDASRKDGWEKTKYRDLSQDTRDHAKKPCLDDKGNKTTRGRLELLELREYCANTMNRIAKRDRVNVFVNHLSFEKRAIDREASQHMGHKATSMERRGEVSRVGEKNREIQQANAQRMKDRAYEAVLSAQVSMQQDALNTWANEERQTLAERLRSSEIDLHSKHRQERDQLKDKQRYQNTELRQQIYDQLRTVTNRLNSATGARKIIRNLLGQTKIDRATQELLQKALQAVNVSERVKRVELQRQQQREREQFQDRGRDERQKLERAIEGKQEHELTLSERLKAEYRRSTSKEDRQATRDRMLGRNAENKIERKPH